MKSDSEMPFSAGPSALGYLFQCRYALLESLCRLRNSENFSVSIEMLDDVVFQTEGKALDLIQAKHHIDKEANLTNASSDLWKSIRIWSELIKNRKLTEGSKLFLITTSRASEDSAAHYLKPRESRNVTKALELLIAAAKSSTNKKNASAYASFITSGVRRVTNTPTFRLGMK